MHEPPESAPPIKIVPFVVFDIRSSTTQFSDWMKRFKRYARQGVEEYYLYDLGNRVIDGWLRSGSRLREIRNMKDWVSPRLGLRFDIVNGEAVLTGPDGRRFATYVDLAAQEATERADRLAAQLRALGVEPEA